MKRALMLVLAVTAVSGCASITRGTMEIYVIETTPPNARATLSTGQTCTTPCRLKVPRRGDFVVTIERNGYETLRATVASGIDSDGAAGMAGNVIFGGIIGAGIDAGTGAMHSHQPNPLQVTLVPAGTSAADEDVPGTAAADSTERPAAEGLRKAEEAAEGLADGEPAD